MLQTFVDLCIQQIQEQYKLFNTVECFSAIVYKFYEYQTISRDPLSRATIVKTEKWDNSLSKLLGSHTCYIIRQEFTSIFLSERRNHKLVCSLAHILPLLKFSMHIQAMFLSDFSTGTICKHYCYLPFLSRTLSQKCGEAFPEPLRILAERGDA